MDGSDFFMIAVVAAVYIGIAAIIAFTIYKIVKMICVTVARNAEVKTFGSSEEYTEFLQWRQDHGRQ